MITGWQDHLTSVLQQKDREEFAQAIVELYNQFDNIQDFIEHTSAYLVSTQLRNDYQRFQPGSFLGFVAAVQMGRYVQPFFQFRALAQSLWCSAWEGLGEPVKIENPLQVELPEDSDQYYKKLDELFISQDFESFFAWVTSGISDSGKRDSTIYWLLQNSGQDFNSQGYKFLYISKSLELMEYLSWKNVATYLHPCLHYMMFAPQGFEHREMINERIDFHKLDLNSENKVFEISKDEAYQLRNAILHEKPESILDNFLGAFEYGVDTEVISEILLLTASQLVLAIPYENWLFPVHGFNLTEGINSRLNYLSQAEKKRLLLMNALALKQVVDAAQPFRFQEPFFTPRPNEAEASIHELEEAIDLSIAYDAMASFESLYKQNKLTQRIFGRLALESIKTDGHIHSGHDLRFAYSAIETFHSSFSPHRMYYVLALVKFLAESEKGRDLDHAVLRRMRNY